MDGVSVLDPFVLVRLANANVSARASLRGALELNAQVSSLEGVFPRTWVD